MRGVKSEGVCGCRVDFVGVCTEYNLCYYDGHQVC